MHSLSSDDNLAGSSANWNELLANSLEKLDLPEHIAEFGRKLSRGERLSIEDGLVLFNESDLISIGRLANAVKIARFNDSVFFNSNVHINQTNICVLACRFCAFRRGPRAKDAYAMEVDEYLRDLEKYADYVDEVHSVGGLHPDWDITHYEFLFNSVREKFPHIHIKALTAVEVKHLADISEISVEDCLVRLKKAGLGSLPGGGAEILDDEVRDRICKGKETTAEYLHIHRTAHNIGIYTNCTMLFGTIESQEQRLKHLDLLRNLQDETKGFQCFVPYPFLPDDTRLPEAQLATSNEILRMIAISRLMLDNIPHIKAYRMNIGDSLAELAINFGADDIDGTVQKESIMHLAGSSAALDLNLSRLSRLIYDAGCIPIQRDTLYSKFQEYIPKEDLVVRSLPMA